MRNALICAGVMLALLLLWPLLFGPSARAGAAEAGSATVMMAVPPSALARHGACAAAGRCALPRAR